MVAGRKLTALMIIGMCGSLAPWNMTAQTPQAVPQAEVLIQRGELHRAEALLRRDLQTQPSAAAHYLLGFVMIQQYRYAEAESFLRQAVAKEPRRADYLHALAKSLLEQGQNLAAIHELNRALAIETRAEYYFAKAMCALNVARLDMAQSALEASVKLQAKNAEAWYQMGRIQVDKGEYENGLSSLKRALSIEPAHVEARYLYGLALRRTGENKAAMDALASVLKIVPGHVGALQNLGRVQLQLGYEEAARATFDRFAEMSDLRDEVEFIVAAVKKNPANVEGRITLARKQLEIGNIAYAVEQLLAARRLQPGRTEIYDELARAFRRQGDAERARQAEAFAHDLRERAAVADESQ